ncbi:MAG: DUF3014 domain-containing protein [Gammaproteobacteria bacterium]
MATSWDSEDSFWKRTVVYSAIAVALVAGGGALYYFKFMKPAAAPVAPPVARTPAAEPGVPAPDHHPIPGADGSDKPLPKLNESDGDIASALAGVFGKKPIDELLVPEMVIRHIVVTVDNLPRNKVAEQMRPLKPAQGESAVATSGDTITLTAENSARYAAFMKLVQGTDTKQLGGLYIRYYPLFQQAYEDLGYPGQYFNDRLVEVIDHLLQTPDVHGPILLKQGRVFYEYADPSLESRSAGQKLLLRMGPANQAILKTRLKELRTYVTSSQDPPKDATPAGAAGSPSEGVASPGEVALPPEAKP